jgi:hypothetical protein
LGNDETTANGKLLGKQAKLWSAPQSIKSWEKTTNNIKAHSHSGPVIARSAAQSKFETESSALQSNPIL